MTSLKETQEAITGPLETPLPKAVQLFLPIEPLSEAWKKKQVHPSRKRRRAEKIAPSCPL